MNIFSGEIILTTKLLVHDLIKSLNLITQQTTKEKGIKDEIKSLFVITKQTNENHKFEGIVNNSTFLLTPLFDYGRNNRIRPEIQGELKENQTSTQITLTYKLPKNLKWLFIFISIVPIALALTTSLIPTFIWIPNWGWLIGLIFFFIIAKLIFDQKINESIRILKLIFKAY